MSDDYISPLTVRELFKCQRAFNELQAKYETALAFIKDCADNDCALTNSSNYNCECCARCNARELLEEIE